MPRRRMIDPFFYTDPKVGKTSRDERSLIVGCVCQADDEGRLQGDPAFLKSEVFKYDKDLDDTRIRELRDSCLAKMQSWPVNHPYRMTLYANSEEEYIFFPNWAATNRPSHATKSQLPVPPPELLPIFSGEPHETVPKPSALGQSSLGQVSQVKVSVGKVSAVREDFTKITDETELTDRLTDLLISAAAGPGPQLRQTDALKDFWQQLIGEPMNNIIYQFTVNAVRDYSPAVLARSYVKAVKYKGGKTGSYRYIATILKEEMAKNRSP